MTCAASFRREMNTDAAFIFPHAHRIPGVFPRGHGRTQKPGDVTSTHEKRWHRCAGRPALKSCRPGRALCIRRSIWYDHYPRWPTMTSRNTGTVRLEAYFAGPAEWCDAATRLLGMEQLCAPMRSIS